MTAAKKQRNANMDLLRIVSMLLIVFLHTIIHGGVLENEENYGSAMYFYVRFTYGLCQVCVNIYIMLSGYFMIKSKFRLQKLVALWMETVFYGLGLRVVFMLTGVKSFSIVSLVSCFFPILTGRYWFMTIYVGMYLVSPFLNTLINAMDKKQHGLLNLCLFGLMSLWPSIHPSIAGMNSGGGWGLAWFVTLYITAAWFRLYYTPDNKPFRWLAAFVLVPALIAAMQCVLKNWISIGVVSSMVDDWICYESAPVYIMTMCLFVGFLNVNIKGKLLSRVICFAAPLTLGVYLIHDNPDVSPWLWGVLALPEKMGSALFVLVQLGCVAGIFAVCIAISAARKYTIGRLEQSNTLSQLCNKLESWMKRRVLRLDYQTQEG